MKNSIMGILAIILGILVMVFPMAGVVAVSFFTGFVVVMLAIWFLIAGAAEMYGSRLIGVLFVILGIVSLIIGFGLIFNSAIFAFLTGVVLYLAGILMIIAGVISLLGGWDAKYRVWAGVLGIVLGIIYIILGTFAFDPVYLGFLIGIWLLLTGIFSIFASN